MSIQSARDGDMLLQSCGLPNVAGAVAPLLQPITIGVVRKNSIDGLVSEYVTEVSSRGMRMPASPEAIALKPEGQRSWRWEQLHCLSEVDLATDSEIQIQDTRYRVMGKQNFKEYGYFVYDITEDYVPV